MAACSRAWGILEAGECAVSAAAVWGEPRQRFGGWPLREVLGARPAVIGAALDGGEHRREVDAAGAGLLAARRVGELDMRDPGQQPVKRRQQGVAPLRHAIEVALKADIRLSALVQDG